MRDLYVHDGAISAFTIGEIRILNATT